MEMTGNGIVLILEDENDKNMNMFNSTYGLEEYLTTINLNDYEYKNILFYIDGEMNMEMSKIYKNRYINKKLKAEKVYESIITTMSSLNISRNEIADIFESVVPKDVAIYISSYHRHPIDEFIGKDKLKEKERFLSIVMLGVYYHRVYWSTYHHETRGSYQWQRKDNVCETNYKLSSHRSIRIFYPYTREALNINTKQEIKDVAERRYIKLSMSWKKDKMIDEFFKRS